ELVKQQAFEGQPQCAKGGGRQHTASGGKFRRDGGNLTLRGGRTTGRDDSGEIRDGESRTDINRETSERDIQLVLCPTEILGATDSASVRQVRPHPLHRQSQWHQPEIESLTKH